MVHRRGHRHARRDGGPVTGNERAERVLTILKRRAAQPENVGVDRAVVMRGARLLIDLTEPGRETATVELDGK